MTAMMRPVAGGHIMRRDWLASMVLHAALLGGALWLVAAPVPQVQRLDVTLRWAAPEPAPAPAPPPRPPPPQDLAPVALPQLAPTPVARLQVTPAPVVLPPKRVPRVRAPASQRPRVQAPRPEPPAPAKVFVSSPLPSAPALVARPAAPEIPSAVAVPVVPLQSAPVAALFAAPVRPAAPAVPVATQGKAATEAPAPAHPTSLASAAADEHAYQQWRTRLEQALLQGRRYPAGARRMGQTGTVVVQLRVAADGGLLYCMLHHSSGFTVLDQAAEQLVRGVAQSLGRTQPPGRIADLRIPIVYELTES